MIIQPLVSRPNSTDSAKKSEDRSFFKQSMLKKIASENKFSKDTFRESEDKDFLSFSKRHVMQYCNHS